MLAPDPRFAEIDALDGEAFEAALKDLFELLGYGVELTPRFDKGADLILTLGGVRTAVQAKRWSTAVGIDAIRQLVDGRKRYACDHAIAVTNNFFTDKAQECAAEWGIELWDRWKLAEYVEGEPPDVDHSICAECGRKVKPTVTKWCLDHPWRYGGNVFCLRHQARRERRVA